MHGLNEYSMYSWELNHAAQTEKSANFGLKNLKLWKKEFYFL